MTRCKIKAVIGAGIALILFGGCGYNQTSNDQVASTENVSNIDKSEDDIKEDNVNITEASWKDGYTIVLNPVSNSYNKVDDEHYKLSKIAGISANINEIENC